MLAFLPKPGQTYGFASLSYGALELNLLWFRTTQ